MQTTTAQIQHFLEFIALQFIQHPDKAQLKVVNVGEKQVRFRLILHRDDVAILIGRNGFTASAIRNILKAAASRDGVQVTLQIISQEEELQRIAALESGQIIEDTYLEELHEEADDEQGEESH